MPPLCNTIRVTRHSIGVGSEAPATAPQSDLGHALLRWSPERELLFDPPETLEIGITPFVVSLVQLVERRVSEVRVHDRRADLFLLSLVIKLEVGQQRKE
jgi:hypothetical protein